VTTRLQVLSWRQALNADFREPKVPLDRFS
jgi:hypothetical protein